MNKNDRLKRLYNSLDRLTGVLDCCKRCGAENVYHILYCSCKKCGKELTIHNIRGIVADDGTESVYCKDCRDEIYVTEESK